MQIYDLNKYKMLLICREDNFDFLIIISLIASIKSSSPSPTNFLKICYFVHKFFSNFNFIFRVFRANRFGAFFGVLPIIDINAFISRLWCKNFLYFLKNKYLPFCLSFDMLHIWITEHEYLVFHKYWIILTIDLVLIV